MAIAVTENDVGVLIDPYGGQHDLAAKLLRHVSNAFVEDPVRILRIARFAARFRDFSVAPETMELMRSMVVAGEVDALVPERIWQELARGLMESAPSRMFAVLRECGALARIMPELNALWGVPQPAKYHPEIDTGTHVMLVLDYAASQNFSLSVRWAALLHDLGKATSPPENWPHHHGHEGRGEVLVKQLCLRLKTPNEARDLAIMTAREHGNVGRAFELRADTIVRLLERCDAFRKPERFVEMLRASESDWFGRADLPDLHFPQFDFLERALIVAQSVPAGQIASTTALRFPGKAHRIPTEIHAARIRAVHAIVASE
jgi:tRNA nucleotidyltransferase (CCA-adding enzyme)